MAKVEVERSGSVAIVWLNRPEVRNAIDSETARLLHAALQRMPAAARTSHRSRLLYPNAP